MKTFVRDEILPSYWANALDGFLLGQFRNIIVQRASGAPTSTVEVPAGAGEARAALSIDGLWRWRDTTVQKAHPGGAAGTYILWATTGPNVVVNTPSPNTDNTDYSFSLAITLSPATPTVIAGSVEFWRELARLTWDGAAITAITPSVGDAVAVVEPPIGALMSYAGSGDPAGGRWLLADGRLISRATPAGAAFYAASQHSYNGGVDPGSNQVRIPDKRGRVQAGADNMGTAAGAAGRLPNSNRVKGQSGGEERHTLTSAESGMPTHGHADTLATASGGTHDHDIHTAGNLYQPGGNGYSGLMAKNSGTSVGHTNDGGSHTHTMTGGVTNAAGVAASAAHNVLQPYEVDNVIVRVY